MREIRLFLDFYAFAMAVLCAFAGDVFAQSVECRQNLNLGSVVADINGGRITVSQDGITMGSKNEKIEANGNAGVIAVRSPIDEKVNVRIDATNLYGDGQDIKVRNVTYNGSENFEQNLNSNTERTFNLGAIIDYLAGQKIGVYNGFYTVSANFETTGANVSELCPITINFMAKDIQLSEIKALNFGTVSKPVKSGGVIRVSSNGGRAVVNGNVQIISDVSNGEFSVEASPETVVYVSFENGILYGNNGSVVVDNFTSNKGRSFIIPTNGKTTIKVGADLTIGNEQQDGTYTGTYGIIVSY